MLAIGSAISALSEQELEMVFGGNWCTVNYEVECKLDSEGSGTCTSKMVSKEDS